MQGEKASILTVDQEAEITNLKRHFPFRICWIAVNAHTNEHITGADYNTRRMNTYLRKQGWLVYRAS